MEIDYSFQKQRRILKDRQIFQWLCIFVSDKNNTKYMYNDHKTLSNWFIRYAENMVEFYWKASLLNIYYSTGSSVESKHYLAFFSIVSLCS